MARTVWLLVAAALLALAVAVPASAQTEEPEESGAAVRGSLRHEGEPVSGVTITVETEDGEFVGEGASDEEGDWRVSLPGPGAYRATLDQETLPEDIGIRDAERETLEVTLRSGQQRTLIFPLGERQAVLARILPRLAQGAVNGMRLGLVIAMAAIGLSLIFGTTKLVNFAHGEMVTFGAVVALLLNVAGLPLVLAAALAMVAGGVLGAVLERGLWKPLRRRKTGLIQMLVISIGLALLMRHVMLLFIGGRSRRYLEYAVQSPLQLGPVRVTPRDLVIMAVSALVLAGVGLMLQRTRLGKAMRAVADNRDLAESSGIDVQRVILSVWILGGTLSALGGVLLGLAENVSYLMGFRLLLLMFAGVILGGLGTAFGALVGSVLVGLVTEMSTVYVTTELKFVWALLVMVLVLLVRPQGILGQRERVG